MYLVFGVKASDPKACCLESRSSFLLWPGGLFELCQVLPQVPNPIGTRILFLLCSLLQRGSAIHQTRPQTWGALFKSLIFVIKDPFLSSWPIKNADDDVLLCFRDLSDKCSGTPDWLSIEGEDHWDSDQDQWHHLHHQVYHPVTPPQHPLKLSL